MILFNSISKVVSALRSLNSPIEHADGKGKDTLKKDALKYLIGRLIVTLLFIGIAVFFVQQSASDAEKIKFAWFFVGAVSGYWLS